MALLLRPCGGDGDGDGGATFPQVYFLPPCNVKFEDVCATSQVVFTIPTTVVAISCTAQFLHPHSSTIPVVTYSAHVGTWYIR